MGMELTLLEIYSAAHPMQSAEYRCGHNHTHHASRTTSNGRGQGVASDWVNRRRVRPQADAHGPDMPAPAHLTRIMARFRAGMVRLVSFVQAAIGAMLWGPVATPSSRGFLQQ